MTSPSEKPQPGTIHSAASIEELEEKLSNDHARKTEITVTAPESTPPSCVFNSQAPESTMAVTEVMRAIQIAAQNKVPQIADPEQLEEEADNTNDGPDAA